MDEPLTRLNVRVGHVTTAPCVEHGVHRSRAGTSTHAPVVVPPTLLTRQTCASVQEVPAQSNVFEASQVAGVRPASGCGVGVSGVSGVSGMSGVALPSSPGVCDSPAPRDGEGAPVPVGSPVGVVPASPLDGVGSSDEQATKTPIKARARVWRKEQIMPGPLTPGSAAGHRTRDEDTGSPPMTPHGRGDAEGTVAKRW